MTETAISGLLVLPGGITAGSVVLDSQSGLIAAVRPGASEGERFPDPCLIFPGFIDLHVHAREDVSGAETHKECYATAGRAALAGGVTHYADMPNNPVPPVDEASYAAKLEIARRSPLPITLYAGIGPGTRPLKRRVPYKAYLGPSVGPLYFRSNAEVEETLAHYRGENVSFHCEDPEVLENRRGAASHEERRPPEAEISATALAIKMAERHDLAVKLCHYSTGAGLELVRRARRQGLRVALEAAPHHLFFDTSMLRPDNTRLLQMNPPLRSPRDRRALIEALRQGEVEHLASDHAPHTLAEKEKGMSGVPHLDTYGAFLTWLMEAEGFTPLQILRCACENPGRFLRPYLPAACGQGIGRIETGTRGDICVLDPRAPFTPRNEDMQTRCGWTPFAGMRFPGRVKAVWLGGARKV